jgi:hypothetical protein
VSEALILSFREPGVSLDSLPKRHQIAATPTEGFQLRDLTANDALMHMQIAEGYTDIEWLLDVRANQYIATGIPRDRIDG